MAEDTRPDVPAIASARESGYSAPSPAVAAAIARAEAAEARLAAIVAVCRERMTSPGRSGMTVAAARLILGLAEGSPEEGNQ